MILRIVLVILALSWCHARWSVDAWVWRRLGRPLPREVPAWPRYLLLLQLVWIYFSGGHEQERRGVGPARRLHGARERRLPIRTSRASIRRWVGSVLPLTQRRDRADDGVRARRAALPRAISTRRDRGSRRPAAPARQPAAPALDLARARHRVPPRHRARPCGSARSRGACSRCIRSLLRAARARWRGDARVTRLACDAARRSQRPFWPHTASASQLGSVLDHLRAHAGRRQRCVARRLEPVTRVLADRDLLAAGVAAAARLDQRAVLGDRAASRQLSVPAGMAPCRRWRFAAEPRRSATEPARRGAYRRLPVRDGARRDRGRPIAAEDRAAGEPRLVAELVGDAEELVVLGDAVASARPSRS